MPLGKVALQPGITTMASPTANEAGWSDGSLVRFRQGLPEKWKGWRRYLAAPLEGRVRALLSWHELAGDPLMAAGTSSHLYVLRGTTRYDITPIDRTVDVTGITVAPGASAAAFATDGPHGLQPGDRVTIDAIVGQARTASPAAIDGIALGGRDWTVLAAPTTDTFTVDLGAVAATGGSWTDPETLSCYLPTGDEDARPGLGWGIVPWGTGGWGMPAESDPNDLESLPPRLWSLEGWGSSLLALVQNGRLMSWSPDPAGTVTTRAAYVENADPTIGPPLRAGGMTVGMPERHAFLFGSSALGLSTGFDPLLVRWSDVEDYSEWLASSLNSAGSFRLQGGSRIVGWANSTLQTLIWTDLTLWTCRFVGLPYVYSFVRADANCGLVAQNARVDLGGTVYWMSGGAFWAYRGGAPEMLECTLHDAVFGNGAEPGQPGSGFNRVQAEKITAGSNTATGEVIWFYPSAGSDECDRYIAYNTREKVWYGGALARTAWVDRGVQALPVAASPEGVLYEHEVGTDADGQALGEFIESGWFDLDDGSPLLFVSRLIPDFQNLVGSVSLTFSVTDYPTRTPRVLGPYEVTPERQFVPLRFRGRQARLRIDGGSTGSNWRMGAMRLQIQPDGAR